MWGGGGGGRPHSVGVWGVVTVRSGEGRCAGSGGSSVDRF